MDNQTESSGSFMYLSTVNGKGGIYAKVVAASVYNGVKIYTIETKAPKFIDAEFEKHRMLSSNSSSSRAIPFKPLDDVYFPFDLRKNQKGMQGYEKISEETQKGFTRDLKNLYDHTNGIIYKFKEAIHKQHLNRYLEPWMYQVKVVTATEWDNFFRLRLAPDAQPEIQELARCMKEAIEEAECTEFLPGQWHLPYVTEEISELGHENECYCDEDQGAGYTFHDEYGECDYCLGHLNIEDAIKISAARCARVSYLNHDNTQPDIEKDLVLAERLLEAGHMTPFEHQATPMVSSRNWEKGITHIAKEGWFWSNNFRGWIQYRALVQ